MKKLTAKPYIRMLRRKLTPTFSSEAMVRYEYHAKAFTLYMIESARSGVNGNRWMAAIWASGANISGLGSTPQQARGALLRKIRGLQRVFGVVTVSI